MLLSLFFVFYFFITLYTVVLFFRSSSVCDKVFYLFCILIVDGVGVVEVVDIFVNL